MNETHYKIDPVSDAENGELAPAKAAGSIGVLLVRTAECLTALLRSPTVTAGLNESRYKVLDALRRSPGGTSTQSELAVALLQSESNLSTLLDRMQQDGLISRVRSATDRRKTLIRLAAIGSDALLQADHERNLAATKVFRPLDGNRLRALFEALELLLERLELELGVRDPNQAAATMPQGQLEQSPGIVPAPHVRLANSSNHSQVTHGHSP